MLVMLMPALVLAAVVTQRRRQPRHRCHSSSDIGRKHSRGVSYTAAYSRATPDLKSHRG